MPAQDRATFIMRPMMMVHTPAIGLITEAASLLTSKEHPASNPLLDEWIMLARAMCDLITNL
jgi:hypothetical protein